MSSTTTITENSSASRILRLFPEHVNPNIIGSGQANANNSDLEGYDEEQIRLMDEVCIVIDADDKPIGSGSKKVCALSRRTLMLNTTDILVYRPSDGEHQSGSSPPCLFRVSI
jgi:hypothetical protein